MPIKAREGSLIRTTHNWIYDVKGLVHPPDRIVAFPRFVPDTQGNRERNGIVYRKVYALSERYELLRERFPYYLILDPVFGEHLCEVPKDDIKCFYNPVDRLRELRYGRCLNGLEADALRFLEFLHSRLGVSWNKLGISGSLLVGLHTPQSDIDLVVYGARNCFKVYETLKSAMRDRNGKVKAYTLGELKRLYRFRSKDTKMSFEDFVATERRKVLQGKFLQHDYFIRCVKDWDEVDERYGDVIYRKMGYAKIETTVSDGSEAIFTPCRYTVDDVRMLKGRWGNAVREIASFRGRFCEQARKGETVIAQGKVEKVQKRNGDTFFRLLLGGKPSDYMVLEKGIV